MDTDLYYSREELLKLGFSSVGEGVTFSRKTSIFDLRGNIGNHVRVDDFCILTGHLEIGNYVHIGAFCSLSGVAGVVTLKDCCSLSDAISIFTSYEDGQADALSGALVPSEATKVTVGDVSVGRAALVGALCVVMPGVNIGDAASVGSQAVVKDAVQEGAIVTSNAARSIGFGKKNIDVIMESYYKLMPEARKEEQV